MLLGLIKKNIIIFIDIFASAKGIDFVSQVIVVSDNAEQKIWSVKQSHFRLLIHTSGLEVVKASDWYWFMVGQVPAVLITRSMLKLY